MTLYYGWIDRRLQVVPASNSGTDVLSSTPVSLTDEQKETLDTLQNQALRYIFGPGLSGRKMRSLADIPTLRRRREVICDKFTVKCKNNPRFAHWFSMKSSRSSLRKKNVEEYKEETARCGRLFNSPLFYFRRRLNGKDGQNLRQKIWRISEMIPPLLCLFFLFWMSVTSCRCDQICCVLD